MKNKTIKTIIIIFLIIYLCTYYIATSSYNEYILKERSIMTKEKMIEFEKDIKENKDITIKDYLDNKKNNHTNKISNFFYNTSIKGTNISRNIIKKIFNKLSKLLEE